VFDGDRVADAGEGAAIFVLRNGLDRRGAGQVEGDREACAAARRGDDVDPRIAGGDELHAFGAVWQAVDGDLDTVALLGAGWCRAVHRLGLLRVLQGEANLSTKAGRAALSIPAIPERAAAYSASSMPFSAIRSRSSPFSNISLRMSQPP